MMNLNASLPQVNQASTPRVGETPLERELREKIEKLKQGQPGSNPNDPNNPNGPSNLMNQLANQAILNVLV